ncbi:MAG: hypothetical protein GY755_10320 [Chloroflexi bacterium]|nr:hypothetical protein [Chloroflexota bacterium]
MKKKILVAMVVAALVGLLTVGAVFAQKGDNPFGGKRGSGDGDSPLHDYMSEAMADALGISVEELDAAREDGGVRALIEEQGLSEDELSTLMQGVREKALAAAVADDAITQEEADAIQERGFGRDGKRGGQNGEKNEALKGYMSEAMADALGISVEEFEAAREDGGVRTLIEEQDLTTEELSALKDSAREKALEAAVEDGVITQEQADAAKERGANRDGKRGGGHGNRDGAKDGNGAGLGQGTDG